MGGRRRDTIARAFGEAKAAEFDLEPGPLLWLIELWVDADQCRVEFTTNGSVLLGLTWSDLTSWMLGADEGDLAVVFRRAIKDLSAAYAETAMAAREVECPAPFDPGARG